ncbi:MAG: hydrogenase formation protein HypD [Bryobacteraceae bacterium]|nr:hydrogenase formation protein HypD [Bryobacteraceae bacterium]
MKHLDEYREAALARALAAELKAAVRGRWTIMEVCGGQTHTILKTGLTALLPDGIELVHGPGCPVCVTPVPLIDAAVELSLRPGITVTSFGDMMRVPGSRRSLLEARAEGGDARVVYSPLDALKLARQQPDREVVFFAVGFETTAPANAMAVWQAARLGVRNFSILVAHVLVPPAIRAIFAGAACSVQALLAPGHVCTVAGYEEYEPIAREFKIPIVVTGFEPADLLEGTLMAVRQLEAGRAEVENQYARAVRREGNPAARRVMDDVFEVCDREWRGVGVIPGSGLCLRREYHDFDAKKRFKTASGEQNSAVLCHAGDILQGRLRPPACPAFGRECTPAHPLGAPMVSSEGACAAYYQYGQ